MTKDLNIKDCFDNKSLHLIILPTEKCNFRCVYCYEDFKIGKMKTEVVTSVKLFLSTKLKELNRISIGWFGGEPLLAYQEIFEIESFINEEIKKLNTDIEHTSNITTNAYNLTFDKFCNLVSIGVTEFQITLDGSKESHNETRILANGKGTYDVIMKNLIAMKNNSNNFRVLLRIHYHKKNEINELLNNLSEEFCNDSRFIIYLRSLEHLGSKNDKKIELLNFNERGELEASLKDKFKNKLTFIEDEDNYICYASKPNSFIIRANGNLAKCTVALTDDNNNIGKINTDGTLTIFNEKLQKWFYGFENLDKEALACPISKMYS